MVIIDSFSYTYVNILEFKNLEERLSLHSFTASGEIQYISMYKHKSITKVTDIFNISNKLRESDAVTINGIRGRVESITKNNPLELWDAIHSKESKISLVRTAYFKLKKAVLIIDPERVIVVEKIHELHKTKKKLIKEINLELQKDTSKANIELINLNRKEIIELDKIIKSLKK